MDFVKREDNTIIHDVDYKVYMENTQKNHQIEPTQQLDAMQHTAISMEQLHQAMQSSLNNRQLAHNFQLPISPRQMSTLMLKTNPVTRTLNLNELPAHLSKNLSMEMELIPIPNESHQNLRNDDLSMQNFSRNLDLPLSRSIHEIDLHNTFLHEQELRSLEEINQINQHFRINDIAQHLNRDIHSELVGELDLSQLSRHNLENDILSQEEARRNFAVQNVVENNLSLDQHITLRLDQNLDRMEQSIPRLDQSLASRLDQSLAHRLDQSLAQRLDHTLAQRLDHRLYNSLHMQEQKLEQNETAFSMPCSIKAEQDDDGYYYDNTNQGLTNGLINGEIAQQTTDHTQPNMNLNHEALYPMYNNHIPIPTFNTLDLYSRPHNYVQNHAEIFRENPQNLVIHKDFEHPSPYTDDLKKIKQIDKEDKMEQPKENLKPSDENKMLYEYSNECMVAQKNEINSGTHNKLTEDHSVNIKGEYVCYKCNEIFSSKRMLKTHAKTCESVSVNAELEKLGKFGCSQCTYRCQSPAILRIHERTHTGEKPYACTFCDYKSGQKNNVAKHILVHMKQKPFGCRYCEYRCAQKNNLVVHERTHTGFKPFACLFCDYRTVQKPNLVKHMYLHTDKKPFSCDICNYRCVQKTNLTKHKQRHVNEKEDQKLDLKNQLKPYKPRQKSVKCPQCSYRCVQKSSLEKHLQFKHSIISEQYSDISDQGLNLMKGDDSDTVQNLSVKKCDQVMSDKVVLPVQS